MKVNLCCGLDWRKDYLNVDVESPATLEQWARQAQYPLPDRTAQFEQHDLSKQWPWPDDSATEILADNCLEHFDNPALKHFLAESFRVLKRGGVLRGDVPDYETICDLARDGADWSWEPICAKGPYPQAAWNALQNFAHGWGHKQVFTLDMLRWWLCDAGFQAKVTRFRTHALRFEARKR